MPRRARPWFRTSRQMWYARDKGKQVPLGVTDPNDEAAAWAVFQRLLQEAKQTESKAIRTVAEVVAAYLADVERRVKPITFRSYRWYLSQFLAPFGTLRLTELSAERVEADSRRSTWKPTTRNNYLTTVQSCLAWAGVKLDVKKPAKQSAAASVVIPEPTYRRCLQHCKGDWHACLIFLWNTGARPSEASAATVEAVDWEGHVLRLVEHKTVASGGERVIYLNDAAFEALTWQRDRYQTGLLFRSSRGTRLSLQAYTMKFQRLSERVGRRVTSYGFRHTYATRALADGESDAIVAALLGHAGTGMVHKHYSHLSEMGRHLGEAARRIGKTG